jgi:hypothetical protein
MRIRVGDPVHDWVNATVFLDGFKLWNCVAADTDEGWVDLIAGDDAGRIIREGDEAKIERMHGAVAVSFRRDDSE